MRDFDWNDVRYFLAVVRTGTLTLAARRLGSDHTTVGRRLSALEASLGAKLIDRGPTGCTPTAQGERFLADAEALESVATRAQERIAGSDVALSGTVRIGTPDGFGSFFLAPRIMTFCDRHPELEVQIVAMPRVFSLSKREADLAIGLTRPAEGRLVSRKLTDYSLRLYAARRYLEASPPIRCRSDLAGHHFVSYIDDLIFSPELDYMPQISRDASARLQSSNLIAQMQATIAGAGLCVLPCFMVDGDPRLVAVLPEEVVLTRSFWLVVHADQRHLARIRSAAEFILAAARTDQSLLNP
ncbi:DNA-binding transcriptional regulator, LysR family [Tistlia consotensis]|uniref:DNA-binding transcriptional regulator, LysR family n=2 Tax=Tistlia TaxID=1321364 RepID=A0A1Y6CPD7_9PROT|nr:DNA-binding transcriptional regulator, LysR family [Tistlia consotensis USBA 355]SNS03007.1 DNA-binding transcriptional regulator, LysR family [Tistlia consotensis]